MFGALSQDLTFDIACTMTTLNPEEFQMLLVHCDLLDELLTVSAVEEIFNGIQQGATESSDNPPVSPLPPDSPKTVASLDPPFE